MLREALSEERASREEDLHNKDGEIATLKAKVIPHGRGPKLHVAPRHWDILSRNLLFFFGGHLIRWPGRINVGAPLHMEWLIRFHAEYIHPTEPEAEPAANQCTLGTPNLHTHNTSRNHGTMRAPLDIPRFPPP